MLAFSIIGCANFNEMAYMCDAKHFNEKFLSVSNVFTLIISLIISLVVTICVAIWESVKLLVDSILKHEDGYRLIKCAFWYTVLRWRTDEDLNVIGNRQYIEERLNL
jgi:hypothetical protein